MRRAWVGNASVKYECECVPTATVNMLCAKSDICGAYGLVDLCNETSEGNTAASRSGVDEQRLTRIVALFLVAECLDLSLVCSKAYAASDVTSDECM